jgi:hypothetical protein
MGIRLASASASHVGGIQSQALAIAGTSAAAIPSARPSAAAICRYWTALMRPNAVHHATTDAASSAPRRRSSGECR